ncbi:hypothetical protein IMZ48_42840 [Candidatus Bathyarchaeota archaeon]|nr:hypothetical protein [Candidatus Bathyarchaeota archaeon]
MCRASVANNYPEMNNRTAFIDFVRGLLNINPLERWSPQQAKLHPFITQQKFTGPFVPPMNLKTSSLNRSPAPGTQQQQQAEALSKQRAQAAQAQAQQAQAQAHAQAQAQQNPYATPMGAQYGHPQGHSQPQVQPQVYGGVYPAAGAVPNQSPGYGATQPGYGQMVMPQAPQQVPSSGYSSQQGGMYQQQPQSQSQSSSQSGSRTGRQRSSTMEQQQSGIPAAIQRVASHLDPTQPIRLQPSPAYYPPPPDGAPSVESATGRSRRGSRAQGRNFVRTLEERTLEEGYMAGNQQWH